MAWYSILPPQLTQLESWAVRIFLLLGIITIFPWAALIVLDASLWLYRMIIWEFPWIGGRARGQQRPRAPSLNERLDGHRRSFRLGSMEPDESERGRSRDGSLDRTAEKENVVPTTDARDSQSTESLNSAYWHLAKMAHISLEAEAMPLRIMTPSFHFLLGALLIGSCLWIWRWSRQRILTHSKTSSKVLANETDGKNPIIAPLEEFNWETTEPPQFRPFRGKEKFNLTMALENLEPSELLLIDKTYKDRLTLRKELLQQHHDIVVAVNSDGNKMTDTLIRAAVSELYTSMLGEYLPTRYPTMFRLENEAFENLVTGETWPTTLTAETPTIQALEILMQTIDEDFLILLPELSPSSADQPKYILQAYTTCFPSGFNPREKLGRRLADIHGPVPGYADKIERSMDRFFARVEVGKYVKRVNWSITTGAQLFAAFGEVHGPGIFPKSRDRRL
ncbi:Protein of unknown function DUF3445 [Penicillium atrosanguineum]|nr:Protein of unknown function DUF3445 [Penicillium atrosanguineum]